MKIKQGFFYDKKIFKIAKDKITMNVNKTRPPNCLTGSGNSSFNLLK